MRRNVAPCALSRASRRLSALAAEGQLSVADVHGRRATEGVALTVHGCERGPEDDSAMRDEGRPDS